MRWAIVVLLAACSESHPSSGFLEGLMLEPARRMGCLERVHRLSLTACDRGWVMVPARSTPLADPVIVHEEGVDASSCTRRWLALAERCPAYVPESRDAGVEVEYAMSDTRRRIAACMEAELWFGLQWCDKNPAVLPVSEYASYEECLAHYTVEARRCDLQAR